MDAFEMHVAINNMISPDEEDNTPCWACKKVNCTCDEDTMQAMDEEMRLEDEG